MMRKADLAASRYPKKFPEAFADQKKRWSVPLNYGAAKNDEVVAEFRVYMKKMASIFPKLWKDALVGFGNGEHDT
jgi:hypothetical protein